MGRKVGFDEFADLDDFMWWYWPEEEEEIEREEKSKSQLLSVDETLLVKEESKCPECGLTINTVRFIVIDEKANKCHLVFECENCQNDWREPLERHVERIAKKGMFICAKCGLWGFPVEALRKHKNVLSCFWCYNKSFMVFPPGEETKKALLGIVHLLKEKRRVHKHT